MNIPFKKKLHASLSILGIALLISEGSHATISINKHSNNQQEIRPITSIIIKYNKENSLGNYNLLELNDYLQQKFSINTSFAREIGNGAIVYNIDDPGFIANFGYDLDSMSSLQADNLNNRLQMELDKLSNDPNIQYADLNIYQYIQQTPNDAMYAQQWHYFEDQGGINLPKAWDITTGSDNVVVGVIDTGIVKHEDYNTKVLPGRSFVSGEDPNDYFDRGTFHGSHVSGTISALTNNNIGVSGVSWNAKILPVKVLGQNGSGSSDGILQGMRWAAGLDTNNPNPNPAKILNMSLGGFSPNCPSSYQDVIDEITANGGIIVVAAGNDNRNARMSSPANCKNVITVAANNRSGQKASYSNYGEGIIDIVAPGGNRTDGVLSTFGPDKYNSIAGTSMASPHVSGVVALMLSVNPELRLTKVTSYLQKGARGNLLGIGIMDAYKTLSLVQGTEPDPDPADPTEPTPDPDGAIRLESGVALYDISFTAGERKLFYIDIPEEAQGALSTFNWGGFSGPIIRAAYNKIPTANDNDCSSDVGINTRSCVVFSPKKGRYYIELYSEQNYNGITLWNMYM